MLGRSLARFPSTWMVLTPRNTNIDQIHVLISQLNSWDSKTALIAFVTVCFSFFAILKMELQLHDFHG